LMIGVLAKLLYRPFSDKDTQRLLHRIQQDLADGTAIVSPPVEMDKDELVSRATETLTSDDK
jgi:hypothetical protein